MYAINAEATPTESAWEKGIALAKQTIDTYKQRHNDSIPRKVSYTLWSSEFIETGGATIAQVLYMLGVEPVRDAFGRVSDLKLIPSAELGRPRIDVVVQTSGQLRDIAASRLFLINRAVEMAAAAKDDKFENQVAASVVEAERVLTEKGVSPKNAREMASFRVFGGANGMYGTGIQGMVESGDRWESESEIADTYLNNMGAFYGDEKHWEVFQKFAFEAALNSTDVVVQPRQSNTWGALSLDHVYEFMGGMNLAVRNVTGKDPDAYLSDYRNRNNMKMQELKEAVGVESRTTILNPTYIKEKMKGGASAASEVAQTVTNTYGWNVMKPAAIDKELWDNIYDVYVKDEYKLNVKDFFEKQNPAALQEVTAVMMETARKAINNYIKGEPIGCKIYEMDDPDVLLWAVWALQQYAKETSREQCRAKYGSLLEEIIDFIRQRKHDNLFLHENGLLYANGADRAITWMNSTVNGRPVIPRTGYIVEINALWYNALRFIADLVREGCLLYTSPSPRDRG